MAARHVVACLEHQRRNVETFGAQGRFFSYEAMCSEPERVAPMTGEPRTHRLRDGCSMLTTGRCPGPGVYIRDIHPGLSLRTAVVPGSRKLDFGHFLECREDRRVRR